MHMQKIGGGVGIHWSYGTAGGAVTIFTAISVSTGKSLIRMNHCGRVSFDTTNHRLGRATEMQSIAS